ncbi:MAG: ring-1,2-phenylacetyl-CoA epoxidase subunit PaaE [Crocinitomicaceae bacterium]|jgi:ring-1,2-phenylacetyl-CoA epoxidase subunit PaaE
MALFKKLFSKSDSNKAPRGFHSIAIKAVTKVAPDTVKIELEIPSNLTSAFSYVPGQYINFAITVNGKEHRRSYSICSGKGEPLAVAVKKVQNGTVSVWFNEVAAAETAVFVSVPEGGFVRPSSANNVVAIAAGSGITPIMSIAKDIESKGAKMQLLYGSKTEESVIFKSDLDALKNTSTTYYLSQESKDGFEKGRIDKVSFTALIKSNLDILKSDAFLMCGPEQLIKDAADTLKEFGVSDDKVHYELFTDPVLMKSETKPENTSFEGKSNVTVIIDGDETKFEMSPNQNVLDAAIKNGVDAPYSCKGGVCSTCKAKVIEGKVSMKLNYSLTDSEIEEGFILTCQSHAASESLIVNYDEA